MPRIAGVDIPADKRVTGLLDLPKTESEIEVERRLGQLSGKGVDGALGEQRAEVAPAGGGLVLLSAGLGWAVIDAVV